MQSSVSRCDYPSPFESGINHGSLYRWNGLCMDAVSMKHGGGPLKFGAPVRDLDFQDRSTAIDTTDALIGHLKST